MRAPPLSYCIHLERHHLLLFLFFADTRGYLSGVTGRMHLRAYTAASPASDDDFISIRY